MPVGRFVGTGGGPEGAGGGARVGAPGLGLAGLAGGEAGEPGALAALVVFAGDFGGLGGGPFAAGFCVFCVLALAGDLLLPRVDFRAGLFDRERPPAVDFFVP